MSSADRDGMVVGNVVPAPGGDNGTFQSDRLRPFEETEMDLGDRRLPRVVESESEAPRGGLRRDGLLKHHESLCAEARELMDRKNQDYASGGNNGDPFANFRLCEQLGICSVEEGIVVRMSDKLSRLARLLSPGYSAKVTDETIRDTLIDLINYPALISAYRSDNAQVQVRGEVR